MTGSTEFLDRLIKMPQIVIDSEGIVLQEEQSVFGKPTTVRTRLSWTELENYSLSLSTQGYIELGEFLSREIDDQGLSVSLLVSELQLDDDAKHISATVVGQDSHGRLPPVPELGIDIEDIDTASRRRYYQSLVNDRQTSAKLIRQLIHDEGTIQKGDLRERLESTGYSSIETPLSATLNVLEHLTEEIERHGRGDMEELRWRGKTAPEAISELDG
jgi:hypothetical protein